MKSLSTKNKSRFTLIIVALIAIVISLGTHLGIKTSPIDNTAQAEVNNFTAGQSEDTIPEASDQFENGTVLIGGQYATQMLATFLSGDATSTYLTDAMVNTIKSDAYGKYKLTWPKTYLANATKAWLDTDISNFYWSSSFAGSKIAMASSKTLEGNGHTIELKPANPTAWQTLAIGKTISNGLLKNLDGTTIGTATPNNAIMHNAGLFLCENDGIIQNVNFILNASTLYYGNFRGIVNFGAVAGVNRGTIDSCSFTQPSGVSFRFDKERGDGSYDTVDRQLNMGFYSGINAGTISNCALSFNGEMYANAKAYNDRPSKLSAGGYVGAMYGGQLINSRVTGNGSLKIFIQEASNNNTINYMQKLGGIFVGSNIDSTALQYPAYNYGWVSGDVNWINNYNCNNTGYGLNGGGLLKGLLAVDCTVDIYDLNKNMSGVYYNGTWQNSSKRLVCYAPTPENISDVYFAGNISNETRYVYQSRSILAKTISFVAAEADSLYESNYVFDKINVGSLTNTITPIDSKFIWNAKLLLDRDSNFTTNMFNYSTTPGSYTATVNVDTIDYSFPYTISANKSSYSFSFNGGKLVNSGQVWDIDLTFGTITSDYSIGSNITKNYDGSDEDSPGISFDSITTAPGNIDGKNFKITTTGVQAGKTTKDVGVYTYTLEKENSDLDYVYIDEINKIYYLFAEKSYVVTIIPQILTLTFSDMSGIIYDSQVHPITATLSGVIGDEVVLADIVYSDNLSGYDAPRNVGNYVATVSTISGINSSNYELSQTYTASFSISPKEIRVTTSDFADAIYDGQTHIATAIVEAGYEFLVGDNVSIKINYETNGASLGGYSAPRNVGVYSITPQIIGDDAINYYVTNTTVRTKTITPRDLTITKSIIDNVSGICIYDKTSHIATPNVSGYADGDVFIVTHKILDSENNEVLAPTQSGTYTLRVFFSFNGGAASHDMSDVNNNYRLVGQDQTYTISKRNVYVKADNINQEYNDAQIPVAVLYELYDDDAKTILFEDNDAGIVANSSISYYDNNDVLLDNPPINAGSYYAIISLTENNATNDNLNIIGKRVEIIINKKVVNLDNVSMTNITNTYDGEEHLLSITLNEGTELASGISGPVYTGGENGSNGRTNAGTSVITATFTADSNHIFALDSETATISANITITQVILNIYDYVVLNNGTYDYDGTAKSITYDEISAIHPAISFTGYSGGEGENQNQLTNSSESTITSTFNIIDSNYTFTSTDGLGTFVSSISLSAKLKINALKLSVTWDYTEEFVYDSTLKTVSVSSISGTVNGEVVTISSYLNNSYINACVEPTSYTALAFINNTNYYLDDTSSLSWKILPATLTVEWDVENNHIFTFDGANKTVSASIISGIIGEDSVSISLYDDNTSALAGKHVASIEGIDNTNYTINTNNTLTWFIKNETTLNVDSVPLVYYYNAGNVLTDLITGATTNSDGEIIYEVLNDKTFADIGEYTIKISILSTDSYFPIDQSINVNIVASTPVLEINLGNVYVGQTLEQIKQMATILSASYSNNTVEGTFELSWASGSAPTTAGDVTINITFIPSSTSYNTATSNIIISVQMLTVNFVTNNTLISNSFINPAYGSTITEPAIMTENGHSYVWKISGQTESYDFSSVVTDSFTLVADWTLDAVDLSIDGNTEVVYNPDSASTTLTASINNVYTTISYAYEWYKEGAEDDIISTNPNFEINNVSDSGKYYLKVTATTINTNATSTSITVFATVIISPFVVDLSFITFTGISADYDGNKHTIEFSGTVPSYLTFVNYSGGEDGLNGRTNAGLSTINANFVINDNNYTFAGGLTTGSLLANITINTLPMTAHYNGENSFVYNGDFIYKNIKDSLTAKDSSLAILTGVEITYKYYPTVDGIAKEDQLLNIPDAAGKYIIEVTLSKQNYDRATIDVPIEITKKPVTINYKTGSGADEIVYANGDIIASIPQGQSIPNFVNIFKTSIVTGVIDSNDIVITIYKHKTARAIKNISAAVTSDWEEVSAISTAGKYMINVTISNPSYDVTPGIYYVLITKDIATINATNVSLTYSNSEYIPNVISGTNGETLTGSYIFYQMNGDLQGASIDKIINSGRYKVVASYSETNDYYGDEQTFYVTINPKLVDVVWENVDNPVVANKFIVKAYYLDTNDKKIYLPVSGIDINNLKSGEYKLSASSQDANYALSLNTKNTIVKISTLTTLWTYIIYGVAGLFVLIGVIIAISLYVRKKPEKPVIKSRLNGENVSRDTKDIDKNILQNSVNNEEPVIKSKKDYKKALKLQKIEAKKQARLDRKSKMKK